MSTFASRNMHDIYFHITLPVQIILDTTLYRTGSEKSLLFRRRRCVGLGSGETSRLAFATRPDTDKGNTTACRRRTSAVSASAAAVTVGFFVKLVVILTAGRAGFLAFKQVIKSAFYLAEEVNDAIDEGLPWGVLCTAVRRFVLNSELNLVFQRARTLLRPYQASVIERAVELYAQGTRRLLVPMATGLGKTVIFTHLSKAFPDLRRRGTLVLVHRDELVQQAVASFRTFFPHLSIGVEKGPQTAHAGLDTVVASVQTLGRRGSGATRLRKYASYGGVVIVDEAHHVKASGMYDDVLNGLGIGSACRGRTRDDRLLAGFTATPRRADGLSLRPFFDHSIGGLDLHWGIANGYLVDIHAYAVITATDIAAVPVRQEDFSSGALSTAVNNDLRNEAAARAMLEYGARAGNTTPRGIAFCAGVRHAHDLASVLNYHGISALAVDGGMSKEERLCALTAFRSGEVSTLTNCGVLTEGFDAPFCDTVIMCRPTQSAPLYMQMMGRGTRPWLPPAVPPPEGAVASVIPKTAAERRRAIERSPKPRMHVIDLVDNCGKHKVMNVAAALGLSPDFRGDTDAAGYSFERVASLASEARTSIKSNDELDETPLMEANTLSELALLVKHYRLLQGAKTAETLVNVPPGVVTSPGLDIAHLSPGDRIGKDALLQVVVESIDDGSEDMGDDDGGDDEIDDEHDDIDGSHDSSALDSPEKSRKRRQMVLRLQRRGARRRSPSGATVRMRHQASGVVFVWQTAGVKDAFGGELHEGGAYCLVASVRGTPDMSVKEVEVARCRLTSTNSLARPVLTW